MWLQGVAPYANNRVQESFTGLQYGGIDFQFKTEDDVWVKTRDQDFARSVLQSIENRMPEVAKLVPY